MQSKETANLRKKMFWCKQYIIHKKASNEQALFLRFAMYDWGFTLCDLRSNIWLEGRPLGLPGTVEMQRTGTPVAGRRSAGNATMTAVYATPFYRASVPAL